jgi:hypothetical protein
VLFKERIFCLLRRGKSIPVITGVIFFRQGDVIFIIRRDPGKLPEES